METDGQSGGVTPVPIPNTAVKSSNDLLSTADFRGKNRALSATSDSWAG